MFQAFLIKYAEIAVKGKNRYVFEDALVKQITRSLKDVDGSFNVYKTQGRIHVDVKSEDYDYDETIDALTKVFGISAICPVVVLEDQGFDQLAKEVVTYLDEEFIIELKIWRGDMYRKDGIKQLNGYLESREQNRGYLVSFSFLRNKEYTAGYVDDVKNDEAAGIEGKEIYEVTV